MRRGERPLVPAHRFRLKTFFHANIAPLVHPYTSFLRPHSVSVRNSSDSDEKFGAPLAWDVAKFFTSSNPA